MRLRDKVGYKPGKQNKAKMLLITFRGWSVGYHTTYGSSSLRYSSININQVSDSDSVFMWYSMYGQHKQVYAVKRREQLLHQWNEYKDLSTLVPGNNYVVWSVNVDYECKSCNKKARNTDKSGDWYWADCMEVSDDEAKFVAKWKKSKSDIDKLEKRSLVTMIAAFGPVEGVKFHEFIEQRYGGVDPMILPRALKEYLQTNTGTPVMREQLAHYEQIKRTHQFLEM